MLNATQIARNIVTLLSCLNLGEDDIRVLSEG